MTILNNDKHYSFFCHDTNQKVMNKNAISYKAKTNLNN